VFEIGTIVSYRERLYIVVGVTPMSVTPQRVEIEDRESERIRRVPYADLQGFTEPENKRARTRVGSALLGSVEICADPWVVR